MFGSGNKRKLEEVKTGQKEVEAEFSRIKLVLEEYKAKHADLQEEANRTRTDMGQLQKACDGLQSTQVELKNLLEAERKAHEETKRQLQDTSPGLAKANEEKQIFDAERRKLAGDLEGVKKDLALSQSEATDLRMVLQGLRSAVQDQKAEIEQVRSERDNAFAELNKAIAELNPAAAVSALEEDRAHLAADLETVKKDLEASRSEVEELKKALGQRDPGDPAARPVAARSAPPLAGQQNPPDFSHDHGTLRELAYADTAGNSSAVQPNSLMPLEAMDDQQKIAHLAAGLENANRDLELSQTVIEELRRVVEKQKNDMTRFHFTWKSTPMSKRAVTSATRL